MRPALLGLSLGLVLVAVPAFCQERFPAAVAPLVDRFTDPAFNIEAPVRRPSAPVAAPAAVQQTPVLNPSTAMFTASPDDAAQGQGVNLVSEYDIKLYKASAPTVVVGQFSLGKPTPDATNTISFTGLKALLSSVVAGDYVSTVIAVGPGGASDDSNTSNPFTLAPRNPTAAVGLVIK
jgi:hypothetical protein